MEIKVLFELYRARIPTILWGSPGVGKTAAVEALARRVGAELICPHVRDAQDLAVPVPRGDRLELLPAQEFARAADLAAQGREVIVFVDELTTLRPAAQAAALRYLDSGRVGDLRLSHSVWRVAAANPPDLAAGGHELEAPTANRLAHVHVTVDAGEWAGEFARYWGDPPSLPGIEPSAWGQARGLVAGFIRRHPDLLLRVPDDPVARGGPWPSPRTWDYVSRVLAVAAVADAYEAVAGLVGEAAAKQFLAWVREAQLPVPEDLLSDPQLLSELRPDLQWAALAATAAHVEGRIQDPETVRRAWGLARHAAGVCRDIAAGTLVRSLCRAYRDGRLARLDAEAMEPYQALVREAQR
ncbi:MAG: ATP-binding protein [Armatimonadota bacterium]|nr:ATP-binding protein [Armatimonadota bacterium]